MTPIDFRAFAKRFFDAVEQGDVDAVGDQALEALAVGSSDVLVHGPFARFTPAGIVWRDGTETRVDAVIWCTGFRPDLQHLQPLDLTTRNGIPETGEDLATRSTDHRNLFFLGYGDWCGPASATLIGVGARARDTVKALAQYLDKKPQMLTALNVNGDGAA